MEPKQSSASPASAGKIVNLSGKHAGTLIKDTRCILPLHMQELSQQLDELDPNWCPRPPILPSEGLTREHPRVQIR